MELEDGGWLYIYSLVTGWPGERRNLINAMYNRGGLFEETDAQDNKSSAKSLHW